MYARVNLVRLQTTLNAIFQTLFPKLGSLMSLKADMPNTSISVAQPRV